MAKRNASFAAETYPLPSRGGGGGGGGGGGVEFIAAVDPNARYTLSLAVETSILDNQIPNQFNNFFLPDGTDGLHKTICYGANNNSGGNQPLTVNCTNTAFGVNDDLFLSPAQSVRLVWKTSLGGWCAIDTCMNTLSIWD